MRKFAALVALAVLAALVIPTAAAARPAPRWEGGEDCRNLFLPDRQEAQVRACVLINTNEQNPFAGDVEGMVRFRALVGRSLDFRVDYVHIYRNGTFIDAGAAGWTHITADEVGEWNKVTTSWISCPGIADFRSVARFKIRAHEGPTGDFERWDSQTLRIDCG